MAEPQHELRRAAVGVVAGGLIACQGCGYAQPPGTRVCPICGFERGDYEGSPYPVGKVQRFDWVFGQRIGSGTDKLVLLALVAHDKPNGKGIFPSHERLAYMTGLSRRAVINALARLEAADWITRQKTRRRGRQISNRYEIQQAELQGAQGALGRVHEMHSKG